MRGKLYLGSVGTRLTLRRPWWQKRRLSAPQSRELTWQQRVRVLSILLFVGVFMLLCLSAMVVLYLRELL
jgi:hypothetical protein